MEEFVSENSSTRLGICTAKTQILSGWASVLVHKGNVLYREQGKGIKPALLILQKKLFEEGHTGVCSIPGASLVFGDRVLGFAAFRLGALMGAGAMWGELVSKAALIEASKRGILIAYNRQAASILNTSGDDLCPMERLASVCKSDADFYSELTKMFR